jgi:hypothetical protein
MKFHRLRQTSFWGDYGQILASGLGAKRDRKTGRLLLHRAGPFAPPMMFTHESLVGFVVLVTQSLKEKLEAANFGNLIFKPTTKKHIVDIPWEAWDREARLPWDAGARVKGERPEEGEPENYLLSQKHSREAASEMEEIWEFIAPDVHCKVEKRERLRAFHYRWFLTAPKGRHRGLFRPPGAGHVLFVDDVVRSWFEREGQGWVDFDEVAIV